MNNYDEIPNHITNAQAYFEYAKQKEEKEKQEKYYNEKPIEQNQELLQKIDKLQDSMEESSNATNKSIKLMIATLVVSILGIIISTYSLFIMK